jgi:hypothetical protein
MAVNPPKVGSMTGRQKKTQDRLDVAVEILSEDNPMTLRQVFYQLVSRQVIENTKSMYSCLSKLLSDARKNGEIPWEWMEDRSRRPTVYDGYDSIAQFAEYAQYRYQLDFWATQPTNLEVWLEKDALSGVFSEVLRDYRVTLSPIRGYDSTANVHDAVVRFDNGKKTTILYFGDYDPSGEDIVRSLGVQFHEQGCNPEIIKVALTISQVVKYSLPQNKIDPKKKDTRRQKYVDKNGDIVVELDALPKRVLQDMIREEVVKRTDLVALAAMKAQEKADRAKIVAALSGLK